MTTKLKDRVTRETALTVSGRPVLVTLAPDGMIELRLKSTRQCRKVPLLAVLRTAGWNADVPKPPTHAQQLKELIDNIEQRIAFGVSAAEGSSSAA